MKHVERAEVELYSRDGNVAVVRLPQRRFPGLLMQGDSLSTLAGDAQTLATSLRAGADPLDLADDLTQQLGDVLAFYAASLAAHGIPLPYNPEPPQRLARHVTDMSESAPTHSRELDQLRTERDALRRELGDLRAWLTVKLKLTNQTPGPQGLTALGVASDQKIVAKIEQLMNDANE